MSTFVKECIEIFKLCKLLSQRCERDLKIIIRFTRGNAATQFSLVVVDRP
jgi:hypothetical protein